MVFLPRKHQTLKPRKKTWRVIAEVCRLNVLQVMVFAFLLIAVVGTPFPCFHAPQNLRTLYRREVMPPKSYAVAMRPPLSFHSSFFYRDRPSVQSALPPYPQGMSGNPGIKRGIYKNLADSFDFDSLNGLSDRGVFINVSPPMQPTITESKQRCLMTRIS